MTHTFPAEVGIINRKDNLIFILKRVNHEYNLRCNYSSLSQAGDLITGGKLPVQSAGVLSIIGDDHSQKYVWQYIYWWIYTLLEYIIQFNVEVLIH